MCSHLADGENGDALCDNGLVVNRPRDVVGVLSDGEKVSGKKIGREAVLVFAVTGIRSPGSHR